MENRDKCLCKMLAKLILFAILLFTYLYALSELSGLLDEDCLMPLQEVFEGSICGYQVKIILNSEGIVFLLYSNQRKRYYQARLPYVLQGLSKEIQQLFLNLDEFFVYITNFAEDKDRVAITETGVILVTYMIQKTKKLMQSNPPKIRIQTEVLMTGMQIRNEYKLQSEISDVKRENLQLQNQIYKLMKHNQTNSIQIAKLREMMMDSKVKKQRESSASSSSSEEKQIGRLKKKKKKFSVISDKKSGIVQLNKAIEELQKQVEGIKGVFDVPLKRRVKNQKDLNLFKVKNLQALQNQLFGKKLLITIDPFNKYLNKHFRVQGNLITKINGYGRYQLLSKQVIPSFGKHYFAMYIEKISHQIFSLGIVKQSNRNMQNSHRSKLLISYFAKTGAIWENGDCRCGGPKIPNGVEMRVVVDMDNFTVKWFMDKKEIACTVIGEHLRRQPLVAYLQFNFEGDQIYWNQKQLDRQ